MRMQLSPDEVRVVQRMREIEDAHRGGWNKALLAMKELCEGEEPVNRSEMLGLISRLWKAD